jgi:hypothetical protein
MSAWFCSECASRKKRRQNTGTFTRMRTASSTNTGIGNTKTNLRSQGIRRSAWFVQNLPVERRECRTQETFTPMRTESSTNTGIGNIKTNLRSQGIRISAWSCSECASAKKRRQHKQQRAAKVERRNERSNVSCDQTKEPRETTFSENSKLTDYD